jgi:hypothetical protein
VLHILLIKLDAWRECDNSELLCLSSFTLIFLFNYFNYFFFLFDIYNKISISDNNVGKGRKAEVSEAEEKDRALFESAFNTMQEGRKANFEKLLDSYNHMELSLEKDEELLRKREEQENKFGEADQNEDDRLLREGEVASDGFDKNGKLIMPEDHAMGKLENWLKTLSSKEIHMLKKLGKKSSGSRIEKEMHVAATRKQKREEASWYACQFKLTTPSASCMDFHSVFAGTLDKHQTEGLNEEEHMRVCNSVEAQLSKIPHVPAFSSETEAGKSKYLGKREKISLSLLFVE